MCDSAPAGGIIPSEETFTEATLTLYVWTFCRFCFGRKGNQRGPKSVDEWSWGQPWRDRTCQGVGLTGRWKCMKGWLGFPSILYFDLTNSCSVLLQALQCRIEVQQDISFSLCYVFVWCLSCGYDTVPFESLEGWHLATCAGDRAALPRSPVMQAAAPAAWWELVTSVAQLCVGSMAVAPLLCLGHKVRILTRRWRIDEEWQEHIEVWRTERQVSVEKWLKTPRSQLWHSGLQTAFDWSRANPSAKLAIFQRNFLWHSAAEVWTSTHSVCAGWHSCGSAILKDPARWNDPNLFGIFLGCFFEDLPEIGEESLESVAQVGGKNHPRFFFLNTSNLSW